MISALPRPFWDPVPAFHNLTKPHDTRLLIQRNSLASQPVSTATALVETTLLQDLKWTCLFPTLHGTFSVTPPDSDLDPGTPGSIHPRQLAALTCDTTCQPSQPAAAVQCTHVSNFLQSTTKKKITGALALPIPQHSVSRSTWPTTATITTTPAIQ